jgi:hypothetical protein
MRYSITLAYDVTVAVDVAPPVATRNTESLVALLDTTEAINKDATATVTNTIASILAGGSNRSVVASTIAADTIAYLDAATDRILACAGKPSCVRADDPTTWEGLRAALQRIGVTASLEYYRPVVPFPLP